MPYKTRDSWRNNLGFLNIYLEMWWAALLVLGFLAFLIFIIFEIAPLGWKIWSWAIPLAVVAYGGLTFLFFSMVKDCVKDVRVGQTKMVGRVRRKWVSHGSGGGSSWSAHHIGVNGLSFKVSQGIHEWVSEGEEVCVNYWPHTKTVSRVDKIWTTEGAKDYTEPSKYVGDLSTHQFHKLSCSLIVQIKSTDMVWFESVVEAETNGYAHCKECES